MKIIYLKNFGKVLVSRTAGLEAFNAIRPDIDPEVPIQINFDDVITVTPSWFDEFLTKLADYTNGNIELLLNKNASVDAILPVLIQDRDDPAALVIKRALKSKEVKE